MSNLISKLITQKTKITKQIDADAKIEVIRSHLKMVTLKYTN